VTAPQLYGASVDNRNDVREFLISRRARLSPEQAGLTGFDDKRRVPGLRRGEVAQLAGVSVEYYTRMERGNLGGVSDAVLDAVARALRLDEAEREHLLHLARAANGPTGSSRRPAQVKVRPSVQRILDAMTGAPAYVCDARMDILAANDLCFALYAGILTPQALPLNLARFVFLDDRAPDFFAGWDQVADHTVAALRIEGGRSPLDRKLTDLVGELVTRSEEFRTRWAKHNVRLHRTAVKRLHHPLVGEIEVTGDALELPADGLMLVAYTTEPASVSRERLDFLASWSGRSRDGAVRLAQEPDASQP
jgi:transcriptional regulator with XRE-family HTH domain